MGRRGPVAFLGHLYPEHQPVLRHRNFLTFIQKFLISVLYISKINQIMGHWCLNSVSSLVPLLEVRSWLNISFDLGSTAHMGSISINPPPAAWSFVHNFGK